ncbi:MAG: hypothetical protein LBV63_04010 [Candidatus Methanoplasma sp.]|jgi:membrane protein YqaA with SNARE-associated domain|nr:hypothetical protein [Candidatus Methanoplasma sp.]
MFSIGDAIYGIFGSNGEWGIILCIFLIFFIDALMFPTLPELFFIISFMYKPDVMFGSELVFVAVLAEVIGISVLYWTVGHVRIPKRVENAAKKYVGFLIMGDERLLLLNRVAPMIPFCGAMIRIIGWDLNRSMLYVVIGCVAKYGVIMAMSDFFFDYFSGDDAQTYTLVLIVAVVAASFALSLTMKKRRVETT